MKPLARVWRGFDWVLDALAVIAGVLLAFMFVSIIYDVTTRNLRLFTVTWVVAVTEYALLYVTALGAPWLLRERGHVSMEAMRSMAGPGLTRWLEKLVLVMCMLACIAASWLSIPVIERNIGMIDVRANFIPRWLMFAPVAMTFALCAVQFARFLMQPGTFFEGGVRPQDGI
jgi:TRAP-type C4-dicarboxylate transport system permease small subunit